MNCEYMGCVPNHWLHNQYTINDTLMSDKYLSGDTVLYIVWFETISLFPVY